MFSSLLLHILFFSIFFVFNFLNFLFCLFFHLELFSPFCLSWSFWVFWSFFVLTFAFFIIISFLFVCHLLCIFVFIFVFIFPQFLSHFHHTFCCFGIFFICFLLVVSIVDHLLHSLYPRILICRTSPLFDLLLYIHEPPLVFLSSFCSIFNNLLPKYPSLFFCTCPNPIFSNFVSKLYIGGHTAVV